MCLIKLFYVREAGIEITTKPDLFTLFISYVHTLQEMSVTEFSFDIVFSTKGILAI